MSRNFSDSWALRPSGAYFPTLLWFLFLLFASDMPVSCFNLSYFVSVSFLVLSLSDLRRLHCSFPRKKIKTFSDPGREQTHLPNIFYFFCLSFDFSDKPLADKNLISKCLKLALLRSTMYVSFGKFGFNTAFILCFLWRSLPSGKVHYAIQGHED